jgi:ketosteroid isomerase-like protein
MVDEKVTRAIDAANARFMEGFVKGDAPHTASGFAEDAVVFPPDAGMVQGKRAIEEFWRTVMASGVKKVQLTTTELAGDGRFVHERGTGILTVSPIAGPPSEQRIKYVVVWQQTAEGWKNLWDIWNSTP